MTATPTTTRHARWLTVLLSPLLGLAAAPACLGQTFSYDGNRWYEIEVSIFTNSDMDASDEMVVPEHVTLAYPDPIRQLVPAIRNFLVPFATPDPDPLVTGTPTPSGEVPLIGPQLPEGDGDFRVTDFSRDPFIALGEEYARFKDYNADIRRSPEHRLLFHAVWRQPVLNRVQATAILVNGGDRFGEHFELEGSLRFGFNRAGDRVDAETNLWFSRFGMAGGQPGRWRLPAPPVTEESPAPGPGYTVTSLSVMNQVRPLVSNDLNYLDHPALGMLVEIRPYQLPELSGFSFD